MEKKYNYYRLGKMCGRAGSVSHVTFESTDDGGRLIFADGYKRIIHQSSLNKKELNKFYGWLINQISKIGGNNEKTTIP